MSTKALIQRLRKPRLRIPMLLRTAGALAALAVLLSASAAWCDPFLVTPRVSAKWDVPVAVYHLGDPIINVTLRATTPPGVLVTDFPRKNRFLGDFEILEQVLGKIRFDGDLQIVEMQYTLQYLKSLDEGVFTRRDLPEVRVKIWYRHDATDESAAASWRYWRDEWKKVPAREVCLVRLTEKGDQPYPLAGPLDPPFPFGLVLKAAGIAVLAVIPLSRVRGMIVSARVRKLQKQLELAEAMRPRRELHALWGRWQRAADYDAFLEACVIARQLEKVQLSLPPGGLLPRLELWLVTTMVLYGGRQMAALRIENAFRFFIERFPIEEEVTED